MALVILAVIVGLLVGSFLNVVIWRVPRGESVVRPRSRCPGCGTEIRARDNVPVLSWVVLRGRCHACSAPISARYPLVEIITAVLFGAMAWRFGASWELPAYAYLAAVGLALAAIDLDTRRLPNVLTLPSYVVAGVLLSIAALVHHEPVAIARAAIGMAALYLFYFALMFVKSGGMGFGDVKLAGVLGMYLAYLSWGVLAVGAFMGFFIGGIASIGLMVARKAGMKSKIPYGPYMVAGGLVAVLWGQHIADAYVNVTLH